MNTHDGKTRENKNQSAADDVARNHGQGQQSFADNRPEAAMLRRMQALVDNSPQVRQLKKYQELVDNSPQARQLKKYQDLVDNSPQARQLKKYQELVDNSPQARQLKAFQDMANKSQQERMEGIFNHQGPANQPETATQSSPPIQRAEEDRRVGTAHHSGITNQSVTTTQSPAETIQRIEDEEPVVQGKLKTVQRVEEEEEPLQGKFEKSPSTPTQLQAHDEAPKDTARQLSPNHQSGEDRRVGTAHHSNTANQTPPRHSAPAEYTTIIPPTRITQRNSSGILQLKGDAHPTTLEEAAPKPNNTGLPDALKAGVENLSGYSMDDVRVHYNSGKPAQLNAHAYTQGTEIHVAPGQEQHLPHEAWHVVQQKQGRVQPTMQMAGVAVNDDVGLEKEADGMGGKAIVQRQPDESDDDYSPYKGRQRRFNIPPQVKDKVTKKTAHKRRHVNQHFREIFTCRPCRRPIAYIEKTDDKLKDIPYRFTSKKKKKPHQTVTRAMDHHPPWCKREEAAKKKHMSDEQMKEDYLNPEQMRAICKICNESHQYEECELSDYSSDTDEKGFMTPDDEPENKGVYKPFRFP